MSRTLKLASVAALAALFVAGGARAAQADAPSSVASLFQRLPDLPATAQEAATWVDKTGRLVHPGLLALRADIDAHQRVMAQRRTAAAKRHHQQSAVVAEDLTQGIASLGIDVDRLQRDPAYAQQVQAQMRKMSPQELMAMSQKMNAPLNRDPRHENAAQAMAEDLPVARAAAQAGEAYVQAQPARMSTHQSLWREADEAVAALMKRPLVLPAGKPLIEWENIGCDTGCRAQWEAYAAKVLPLIVARDTEALRIRRAALQRDRAGVAEGLKTADRHLQATQHGASSRSEVNQMHIVNYDAAAVAELSWLVERITDSVASAAVTVHCGSQKVLAPGAVCR